MNRLLWCLEKILLINFSVLLIFSPYHKSIPKVCFCVGIVFWCVMNIVRYRKGWFRTFITDTFLNKPLYIFLGVTICTILFSRNPYHSQSIFFERYLPYFFLFWMGAGLIRWGTTLETENRPLISFQNVHILIFAFLLSGLIFGLGGVWDYFRFHPHRLWTTFGREISFRMFPLYLVYYIPLSFALALFSRRWLRVIALVNLFLLIPCWVWQGSRMAWVAIPLSLLIITFIKDRKWVPILLLFFVMVELFLFSDNQRQIFSALFIADTWELPFEFWTIAITIFKDHPLFGAGIGMYENLYRQYEHLLQFSQTGAKYLHAHNVYLETMAEMGIAGILAFLGTFIVFFKTAFHSIRATADEYQTILLGLMGTILATLLLGFWGSIITVGVQGAAMFWFLFGIAAGLVVRQDREVDV